MDSAIAEITDLFHERYGENVAVIISTSLAVLDDGEIFDIQKAISDGHQLTDIAHDIHGMSARDALFLPRVVGRNREVSKDKEK